MMSEDANPYDADGYLADEACRDAFDKIGRAGRPLTLEELHGPPDLRERRRVEACGSWATSWSALNR